MAVLFRERSEACKPPACEHCREPMYCLRIERDKLFWRCRYCYSMSYVYIRRETAVLSNHG
jgi:hypothetical protein